MATRYHQWKGTACEGTAVCRWLASQVRRLMKRVELLELPDDEAPRNAGRDAC